MVEGFGVFERFLRPCAFDELANLTADRAKHFQQVRVRLANFVAEKFHDPEHFTPAENRKGKRPVQPRLGGCRRAWKVCVHHHVRNPGWLTAGPHPPWQSDARGKSLPASGGFELAQIDGGSVPYSNTPQHLGVRLDLPDRAHVPTQVFANSAYGLRRGFSDP